MSQRLRLSPRTYALLTAIVGWAVAGIIVTGGAVRLTGSGLGCPDWPSCTEDRFVAELDYHQMIEFVNRMVTGLVSIGVIVAVLGAYFRVPRRRDLVWLAFGLVAGVLGQIVLGGVLVLFDLWPPLVMGHFVLSLILLAVAVVLHHRATRPDTRPIAAVPPDLVSLGRTLLAAVTIVILTGTVVTGSGPHGGDTMAERLSFHPSDVARVHGASVVLFLLVAIVTTVMLQRANAGPVPRRAATVLLVAIVLQGAVGYTQYFTGIPALLVGIHLAGAAAVWTATIRFYLALFHRPAAPETIEAWPAQHQSNSSDPTSVGPTRTTSSRTAPGS